MQLRNDSVWSGSITIRWVLDPRDDDLDLEIHGCGCGCEDGGCGSSCESCTSCESCGCDDAADDDDSALNDAIAETIADNIEAQANAEDDDDTVANDALAAAVLNQACADSVAYAFTSKDFSATAEPPQTDPLTSAIQAFNSHMVDHLTNSGAGSDLVERATHAKMNFDRNPDCSDTNYEDLAKQALPPSQE